MEDARAKLAGIARGLRDAEAMPAGIARHGALVAAFIEAGELAQGVADAAFDANGGRDARSPAGDAATALLTRLAAAVRLSWGSAFARFDPVRVEAAFDAAPPLPETLRTKRAEGFAFYALYPEAYLEAAQAAGFPLGSRVRVVGIRSIGVALGALVAAASEAPPPVTLRPVGHPFRRELSLSQGLEAELLADPPTAFAVADEGPGLSGSSFGAVADFLEDRGVPPGRIHFFPSHGGEPGPRAAPRHRARWAGAHRHVVGFDALAGHRLPSWVEDLVGAPVGPLEELSGGAWRRLRYPREAGWPPVNAQAERRKFLLRACGGGTWLLKFAGLGREGERKLERARALHSAGLSPAVAGFRHGFLVEEWVGDARPFHRGAHDAARLAERVGRYLGFRARCFPAGAGQGATLAALRRMARHNVGEGMGEEWARRLEERTAGLESFEPRLRRIETDNRLHAWEWLPLPDGRLLKADALDHHAAHDLVGCQDVAWDVAGAVCELGLEEDRGALLAAVAREAGRAVEPGLVRALTPCYLAFQLGACVMAAQVAAPEEAARLRADTERYAALLRRALGDGEVPG
ncbi:hypothetical protein GCM10009416_21760 [Craurococcus roseus]|uniref:Aminoglycoside phosphotransferase domain-containing protein n=2 Tax=Craurococcus roseus TaxID=77585 RepID=A0ABN1F6H2_9PROT